MGKKILLLSHQSELRGGAELSLLNIIKILDASGYKQCVILPQKGSFSDELTKINIEYKILNNAWWIGEQSEHTRQMVASAILEIIDLIEKYKPDISITNSLASPSLAYASAAKRIRHLWFIREYVELDHGLKYIYPNNEVYELIKNISDGIIYNSNHLREYYSSKLGPEIDVEVIYPEVDPMLFEGGAYAKPGSFKPEWTHITSVGGIQPGKGQLDIVKALSRTSSKVMLHLVGAINDPEYASKIRDYLIEKKMQDCVVFEGQIEKPYAYIQNADALVVSSKNEAFGRVGVESVILGTPIISTKNAGVNELLDGLYESLQYNPENHKELANKVDTLLDNQEMYKQLGKAARKRVLKVYENQNKSNKLVKFIESILRKDVGTLNLQILSEMEHLNVKYRNKIYSLENELSTHKARANVLEKDLNNIKRSRSYRLYKIAKKILNYEK